MTTRLSWGFRDAPLAGAAAAAGGVSADLLAAATANRLRAGAYLRVVRDDAWIIVLGELADLSWVDGVLYLGWEAGLLVPCTLAPSIPTDLLRRSLSPQADELVAIVPGFVLRAPMPVRPADVHRLAP